MMRLALSPAAAGLLRALLPRGGVERDRILLTEFRSTDWQSLTFTGEQHRIRLRVPGRTRRRSSLNSPWESGMPNSPFPAISSPTSLWPASLRRTRMARSRLPSRRLRSLNERQARDRRISASALRSSSAASIEPRACLFPSCRSIDWRSSPAVS
jgi:hypothetical protein